MLDLTQGCQVKIGKEIIAFPFKLWTTPGKIYQLEYRLEITLGKKFKLSPELRKIKEGVRRIYQEKYHKKPPEETVIRLDKAGIDEQTNKIYLLLSPLSRNDVIITNFSLDFPALIEGKSIREFYSINSEILKGPAGLENSPLANTLGISVVVYNPEKKQVLISKISKKVVYPSTERKLKVSAGAEIKPEDYSDPYKTVRRVVKEEAGIEEIKEIHCLGLGRDFYFAIPELLFKVETSENLEKTAQEKKGKLAWENKKKYALSFFKAKEWLSTRRSEWIPQHAVCLWLCLLHQTPEILV